MLRKKTLPLLFVAFALLFAMALFAIPVSGANASAHDIPASEYDPSEFSELTYGIYWYQSGNSVPVAAKDATNYDPTKPTIIYAHGMKTLHEGLECREGLSLKDNNYEYMVNEKHLGAYKYEEEFYQPLLDQGYNVGMFFWNQLADCWFTEECKFWVTTSGDGMSYGYVDENGNFKNTLWNDDSNPTHTVTYLYRDCLVEALGKDFSGHLQLVGHSMGGQLTLAVSQALCCAYDRGEIGSAYLPDRVTLIDPYIGSRACTGTVDTTGEVVKDKPAAILAAEAAKNVADHGIPIEAYGANESFVYRYFQMEGVGIGEMVGYEWHPDTAAIERAIRLFSENMTWVYLNYLFDLYSNFTPTHTMAVDYYFTTMYQSPAYDNGNVEVPSFKASDDHIRALKGVAFSQRKNNAVAGSNPIYQSDSLYVRVNPVDFSEVYPSAIAPCLSGTVKETEKSLTVKLLDGDQEVATVTSLKGKFFFSGLISGDYTVVVYDKDVQVSDPVEVTVGNEEVTTIEKINAEAVSESYSSPLFNIKDIKIFAVCVGAGLLVLICLIIALKRRNFKGSV